MISGIRTFKSLFAAALAICWSQRIDASICGPGDYPRVSILSIGKDQAQQPLSHLVGRVIASDYLRSLMVGDPTGDGLWLAHPSGSKVEVKVVAGARAGGTLTARWSAGVVFDEWPRMHGDDEHVVNYDESRRAVAERLLPGAGIFNIGSPHAPFGPAYDSYVANHGKPSADHVFLKTPAYDLNPFWWTQERVEDARKRDENTFRTEVEADFATPDETFLPSDWLERSRRTEADIEPAWGHDYAAGMDPATRGNGWTLVVATREGVKRRVVLARQWLGSRSDPLSSREVMSQAASLLKPYGLTSIYTDRYGVDFLRELAGDVGLSLVPTYWDQKTTTERWTAFRARLGEGLIDLHPDPVLRADLQRLVKRITQAGVQVHLPKTSDGRHCDYAPALILSLSKYLDDVAMPPPDPDSPDGLKEEQDRMRKAAEKQYGGRRGGRWFR